MPSPTSGRIGTSSWPPRRPLQEEGAKLADVASGGDMAAIGAQVKNLGKACGDCHKPFRKPKEERFQR